MRNTFLEKPYTKYGGESSRKSESAGTMRKLCLSTKFPHHEIR